MSKNWIPLRQLEGTASRQAHVALPAGTYELTMPVMLPLLFIHIGQMITVYIIWQVT